MFRAINNVYASHKQILLAKCSLRLPRRLYQEDVKTFLEKEIAQHHQQQQSSRSQVECEKFWAQIWNRSDLFKAEHDAKKKSFTMLLPPPNITGKLHIGHSLTVAIEDAIIRYHRMVGHNVRWYGGTDHAGIATQMIIENKLWAEQKRSRKDVSREEFYQIFENWKEERVKDIEEQLRSLGASIDHQQSYFTLSPAMSTIVNKAFIDLFNRNLIYRSSSMVNWSYYLQSTLSDIEVEHKFISKPTMYRVPGLEQEFQLGVLHRFKYPLDTLDSKEAVEIATTRIESLMGDVALCVNPNDERNRHLIGRLAINPFTKRPMPILADEEVKPDFGTGVLKLTPAHSAIDFEIAKRHQLPLVKIFDDEGKIDCDYAPFNGVHRYAAKEMVKKELERLDLYCGFAEHPHWLPTCSRSGDIIESRIVPQWFLRCDEARYKTEFVVNRDNLSESSQNKWRELRENLAEEDRNISVIPSGYRNAWKDWFSRHQDWCISRQIFYGHRIPAYQIIDKDKPTDLWVAGHDEQDALKNAKAKYPNVDFSNAHLCQDNDVLDTWFSSGLLPLAVGGFFDNDAKNTFQKLSLMETGHDIICFWVARMVLLSMLIANKAPFERVLLHGMICDGNGKKMSKSKGNVVNPEHVIAGAPFEVLIKQFKDSLKSGVISEPLYADLLKKTVKMFPKGIPECGADILRLSLLQANFRNQNISFDLTKTIKKRTITNKMHNTIRFIAMNLSSSNCSINLENQTTLDRWILNKYTTLLATCRTAFESYDLHVAARKIQRFWIKDLCDVYLEAVKADQRDDVDNKEKTTSMAVLVYITKQTLVLLHPIMPFITEHLYQQIEYKLADIAGEDYVYKSILLQDYPSLDDHQMLKDADTGYQQQIDTIFAIIRKIRWFRQRFLIHKAPVITNIRIASVANGLDQHVDLIQKLTGGANNSKIEFVDLYDIYKYEDCYIAPLELDAGETKNRAIDSEDEDDEVKDSSQNANSLTSKEMYIMFTIDEAGFKDKLDASKYALSTTKMEELMTELQLLHSNRFSENYKRTTKLVT